MANQAHRLTAALALLVLGGCGGSTRRGEPLAGKLLATDASQQRGRLLFMQHCHSCHPGGEAGLGPSLNDRRVPARLMHPSALKGKQLDDLAAYLAALRRNSERLHEPLEARDSARTKD